jgi:hypothetical protein
MNAGPVERWRDELTIIAVRARLVREQSRLLAVLARAHAQRSAWRIANARRVRRKRTGESGVVRPLSVDRRSRRRPD